MSLKNDRAPPVMLNSLGQPLEHQRPAQEIQQLPRQETLRVSHAGRLLTADQELKLNRRWNNVRRVSLTAQRIKKVLSTEAQ